MESSNDVIVSTWQGMLSQQLHQELLGIGVNVVLDEDPGTILKYSRGKVKKGFNFTRQICGTLCGARAAKYDYVVRTRTDVTLNYEKAFESFCQSSKELAFANVTTICPKRIFAPDYHFHGSDWLLISRRNHIVQKYTQALNGPTETELLQLFPRMATEQYWTLANIAETFTATEIRNSCEDERATHRLFMSKVLNLSATDIELTSPKYKNRAIKWATYHKPDFSDDTRIGPISFLPYYLAASLFR